MVETQEIRDAFVSRLNQALDSKEGVRKGRGRNVDFYEGVRAHPAFSASTQATHKWLKAESMPGRANMLAIAEWLGVRVEWLQYGEGDPHQPATSPAPAGQGQAEPDRGTAEVVHHAGMLAMAATPRSREILRRIAMAADEGRLTEEDLNLLDQIAARFESRQADPTTTPAAPHQRLREKLKRND